MRASCSGAHGVLDPLHPRESAPAARTTLPALPLMLMVPTTSAVGSAAPVAPGAIPTRNRPPAGTSTPGSATNWLEEAPKLPVPVADAYWTESPARDAGAVPRLNSSTKSALYGAPLLPPPP